MAEAPSDTINIIHPVAYAVVIHFEEGSVQPIIRIWKALKKEGITQSLYPNGILPHLTLGIFDSLDCEACQKDIKTLTKESAITSIITDHFGIFPNPSPIIFAALAANYALIDLQKQTHHILENHVTGSWEIYKPENWVPHCTLASNISGSDLLKALEICMQLKLPIELETTQIGIVDFEPQQPIFTVSTG